MKYIREGRFGPPKCWKTGAVCSTYPTPMLVFEYEPGGLEIVRNRKIRYVNITELKTMLVEGAPLPVEEIIALDLCFRPVGIMDASYTPAKDTQSFDNTIAAINAIAQCKKLPFKTIVVDTVTGLSDAIWSHQAVNNAAALVDARKWAGNIGMKVKQIIDFLTMPQNQCNVVFILHTEVNKDETTGKVTEQPMVYSKLRDYIGAKFSQFFYQHLEAGKPIIRAKGFDLVAGIGARWPDFKNEKIEPTFKGIYGAEPDVFQ